MSGDGAPTEVYFVSGDIYTHFTGGALCDRMIVDELRRNLTVHFVIPQIARLQALHRPLVAGLINNVRNVFRWFPRRSLLFLEYGIYRDCFLAANVWRWLYGCRTVGIVYHLDYELPEIHGGKKLRAAIEKTMIRACDFVLTISQSTAQHLQVLGQPSDRIAQIPVSRRFGPQELRERPLVPDQVTFLFVGSIEPRKGLLDAVKALGICGSAKRIVFRCVGGRDLEGPYCREMIAEAAKYPKLLLELPGKVSHEELIEEFRHADAFLFPSHWEGYGIAIEEAMCFALPVVAYHAGAVPELVEDGETGWLAPVGDIAALARAAADCIDRPLERSRRGNQGLAKARETTAKQNLGEILGNAINRVCNAA